MKKNIYAICVGLPIALIFAISVAMNAAWIGGFDHFFQQLVQTVPNLKGLMLKITFLASPKMDLIWMLLLSVILWLKKRRPLAINIIITLISADALGYIIKHLIQRARPVQHLAIDDGFSFPSGHVLGMSILVIWLMMILLPKVMKNRTARIWINVLLIVWLIIVMISRVYVYAHYPSDVCASVAIALAWIGIVQLILNEIGKKIKE
ncbi:phosphatase PAP2 family protein [Lactobacillus agrestimuris]|uniref:phosphatase PAP2 family protein n=1 Tax=Lactobacillus agrestimuris TaxID=2941328 RepID=UPI00204386AC|nr:phosphatase PAP2 family protein [Lactobacillus agrestimuris]